MYSIYIFTVYMSVNKDLIPVCTRLKVADIRAKLLKRIQVSKYSKQ